MPCEGTDPAPPLEDPNVLLVEAVLADTVAPYDATLVSQTPRSEADHALWVCACVAQDEAPAWLVHDTRAGQIAWCRVPPDTDVPDLVDARLVAGGHTDAHSMLLWLLGEQSQPPGDVDGDQAVFPALKALLRDRPRLPGHPAHPRA